LNSIKFDQVLSLLVSVPSILVSVPSLLVSVPSQSKSSATTVMLSVLPAANAASLTAAAAAVARAVPTLVCSRACALGRGVGMERSRVAHTASH
jgi:hypothetical protein